MQSILNLRVSLHRSLFLVACQKQEIQFKDCYLYNLYILQRLLQYLMKKTFVDCCFLLVIRVSLLIAHSVIKINVPLCIVLSIPKCIFLSYVWKIKIVAVFARICHAFFKFAYLPSSWWFHPWYGNFIT